MINLSVSRYSTIVEELNKTDSGAEESKKARGNAVQTNHGDKCDSLPLQIK